MLAAVPAEKTRILEMFNLALSMASVEEKAIPAPLADYFDKVLSQARQLLCAPDNITEPIMPEAIQLALDFRDDEMIRKAMEDVTSIRSIDSQRARSVLTSLERSIAA